jgi:hypothetical protein
MLLSDLSVIESMLESYKFTAEEFIEDDGSVTLSLVEIDLVVNGKDKHEAILNMAKDIIRYSEDYYEFFDEWYNAPNRRQHLPYVFKSLIINDVKKIGDLITCLPGRI